MITHVEFCQQLREQFLVNQDKILLRVVMSPDFERPWEFTGRAILERAEELVSGCVVPKDRAVVLLLLPHSPELFLLQVGLVLKPYSRNPGMANKAHRSREVSAEPASPAKSLARRPTDYVAAAGGKRGG